MENTPIKSSFVCCCIRVVRLARLVAEFPHPGSLHPFERSLLNLSLPDGLSCYLAQLRAVGDLKQTLREQVCVLKLMQSP